MIAPRTAVLFTRIIRGYSSSNFDVNIAKAEREDLRASERADGEAAAERKIVDSADLFSCL